MAAGLPAAPVCTLADITLAQAAIGLAPTCHPIGVLWDRERLTSVLPVACPILRGLSPANVCVVVAGVVSLSQDGRGSCRGKVLAVVCVLVVSGFVR